MTDFAQELRHRCRNPRCRSKLPAPVANAREAFCTREALIQPQGGKPNKAYRVHEHLTEDQVAKLLATLKHNRHGHRDWLIGLLIYRHGLRVSEACDLRWDDLDLTKRTVIVRRLKGSIDSSHYLDRDELAGIKLLRRQQEAKGIKSAYVFVNERAEPFRRMGIARMIERAGEAAKLPFPTHVHAAVRGYPVGDLPPYRLEPDQWPR